MKLRKPPYAKRMPENDLNLWIYCGSDAWERVKPKANGRNAALALPPDSDPSLFDWSCCAGRDATVIGSDCPPSTLECLAHHLLTAGVPLVVVLCGELPEIAIYRREEVSNAA